MARFHAALLVVAALLAGASAGAAKSDAAINANPVRKVVTLLQKMAEKVAKEAKQEEELYDKFMCYCKTSGGDLAQSIADSNAKIPQVQTDIEQGEAENKRLKQELISHQEDRSSAKVAMEAATAQRENEHSKYVETSDEYKGYLAALNGAIPAIEKGMAGTGFLQSKAGAALRQAVIQDTSVTDYDRQMVTSFLGGSSADSEEYIPKGGEIAGILKTIRDDFQKNLDEVTAAEEETVKVYEELVAAKTKQVQALGAAIEKKTARVGELQVSIANMKNDLTESQAALIADQKLSQEIGASCDSKSAEWEERKKVRSEELVAIHDTIKILNDDDALELFKKTLPSASLLQVASDESKHRKKALNVIENMRHRRGSRPELDFMVLALQGKKVDMSKVIKMIDNMAALLKQEQDDDDQKKEYCEKQIDFVEDKGKELAKKVEDLSISVEEKGEAIKEVIAELKGLAKGIQELDKMVAEATEDRKEANAEYTELMSSNTAAKELLTYAKNRLNKFYNPGLYKAPPKRELNEEEQIYTSMGGELEPTAAPGGIAGTGVTALEQGEASLVQVSLHDHSVDGDDKQQQPPPPSTWGAYQKKNSETTGVVAMVDLLIRDIDKEMTEAEVGEKNSQKEYEETMNDAAKKRAADLKSIAGKEKAKADLEEGKATDEASKEVETQELQATRMVEMQLHQECDWLVQNFDLRKSARAEEADALQQAKAILSGADFTLVQGQAAAPASRNLRGV